MKYLIYLISLLCPFFVFANDLYEVRDVAISSNAVNITKSRELAINEGQIQAFKIILSKIQSSSLNRNISNEVIPELVREYEIKDEKMFTGKYKGTINVSFSKIHVDNFLLSLGIKKSELENLQDLLKSSQIKKDVIKQERKILVLPLIRKKGELVIWEEDNTWLDSWKQVVSKSSNSKYIVPVGDLQDINLTSKINIASANFDAFSSLLKNYHANEILIVVADSSKQEELGIYTLNIMIKHLDDLARNNVLENYTILKGEDLEGIYVIGVENIISSAPSTEKYMNIKAHGSDESHTIMIINTGNSSDWKEIQKKLSKVELVSKYNIKRISSGKIYLDVYFYHSPEDLVESIQSSGLQLKQRDGYLTLNVR